MIRRAQLLSVLVALILFSGPALGAIHSSPVFVLGEQAEGIETSSGESGQSAVAWYSPGEGLSSEKWVQLYRLGVPLGEPVLLPEGGVVANLEVVASGDGGFLAFWIENDCPICSPPAESELYVQAISPSGALVGSQVRLPGDWLLDAVPRSGGGASVAALDGSALGRDVYAYTVDARGRLLDEPMALDLPDSSLDDVRAFEGAGGGLFVVYEDPLCGGSVCDFPRLFARPVEAPVEELMVAERSVGHAVAPLPDGRAVVAWLEAVPAQITFPPSYRIRARVLTSEGLGQELELPDRLLGPAIFRFRPPWVSVSTDAQGRVVLSWVEEQATPQLSRLWVQLFTEDLDPIEGPVIAASSEERLITHTHVSAEGKGQFLVTWTALEDNLGPVEGIRYRVPTEPCEPGDRTLCFFDGLFEAEAFFETAAGRLGGSGFEALGDQAGYAWFGRQDNPEMLVKMLDGGPVNGRFWLLAGSLSTNAVTLRLRNTQTGLVWHYSKEEGTQTGFRDFEVFPVSLADRSALPASAARDLIPLGGGVSTGAPAGAGGSCVPSATVVCLHDGRFRLELDWEGRRGRGGEALGRDLTPSSAVFWFERERNPEVLVKILDGTALNGRYWLFFGSATATAIDLTVTDTVTGSSQTYARSAASFEGGRDLQTWRP